MLQDRRTNLLKSDSTIYKSLVVNKSGVTLTSVVVAVALSGVLSLVAAQLFKSQRSAMATLGIMEARSTILKHYEGVLVAGWDQTRKSNSTLTGALNVYYRSSSTPLIPSTGLYLGDDIYTSDSNGWWKVTATGATLTGAPINSLTAALVSVTLKVEFDPSRHPYLKTELSAKERVVFFHHNVTSTATECGDHKAIIQYDFISNFHVCSTWPLVKISQSSGSGDALVGFDPAQFTAANKYQLHTKYEGTTASPINCGPNGFISSISNTGVITCSPKSTASTIGLTQCSSYVNSLSESGVVCDSGPPGPTGPDGSPASCGSRLDKNESCPSALTSSCAAEGYDQNRLRSAVCSRQAY